MGGADPLLFRGESPHSDQQTISQPYGLYFVKSPLFSNQTPIARYRLFVVVPT